MADARSNRLFVVAGIGAVLLAGLMWFLTQRDSSKKVVPTPARAHDSPIVVADGSIHVTTKDSDAFQSDPAGSYHYGTANKNSTIHIRFGDGSPDVDLDSLANWKIHLTVSDANGTEKITLCPDANCKHDPVEASGRVYIRVSGAGQWTELNGAKRLEYSDTSSGCAQVGSDNEGVCVHLRRIRISNKDDEKWHVYACGDGNCTITIGDPAQPPDPPTPK